MIVYRGNRYGGNGWREGVIGGGIFWREVVKYSKYYVWGELDGGMVGDSLNEKRMKALLGLPCYKCLDAKLEQGRQYEGCLVALKTMVNRKRNHLEGGSKI